MLGQGNNKLVPLVLTVIMIVSLISIAGVSAAVGDQQSADPLDLTEEDIDADIDEKLLEADRAGENIEVVVRFGAADFSGAETESDVIETQQAHAKQSQTVLTDYAEATDGLQVKNTFWMANAALVNVETDLVSVEELAALPHVDRIHPNFEVEAPEPPEHTESTEWTEGEETYGLNQVNATEVWEKYGTQGEGVRVSVLDTGVDIAHPDLDLYTEDEDDPTYPGGWAEFDATGEKHTDTEPHDVYGHGSHVSGTVVGGDAYNGTNIGVAPGADLMHGKVLDDFGGGTFASVIAGFEWSYENDADVISMSLGMDDYVSEFVEPVEIARESGVPTIGSTGNSGAGTSSTPGNLYSSINVGASDESADITPFSSGEEIHTGEAWGDAAPDYWPDEYITPSIAAPGAEVLSAAPTEDGEPLWAVADGTSMAAPHVAGVVALSLSTTGDTPVEEVEEALYQTAWKPSDAPSEQDIRYGHGIANATAVVDNIADNKGVNGTVTDTDDAPIEGATVTVEEASIQTETDEHGAYEVYLSPGEYTLHVDAFGFEQATVSVEITDESFVTQDFELEDALEGAVVADQPDTVEMGDEITMTHQVANAETITIDAAGSFNTSATELYVDGAEATYGEPVDLGDHTGEVEVVVETMSDDEGDLELTHTLSGLNDNITLETGPTAVLESIYEIGVVGEPHPEYGMAPTIQMADKLEDILPASYEIEILHTEDVLAEPDAYDSYVVQSLHADEHPEVVREFVDETRNADTGVVYTSNVGDQSNGVIKYGEATGYPADMSSYQSFMPIDVSYELTQDHEIFEGVGEAGDVLPVYSESVSNIHSFEDFHGETIAEIGQEGFTGFQSHGGGIAVDDASQTVLATPLGQIVELPPEIYEDEMGQILSNSVQWATESQPVSVAEDPDRHVTSDETISTSLTVDDVDELMIDRNSESTLSEDNLTLLIDDQEVPFGVSVGSSSLPEDEIPIEIEVADDSAGTVALDYAVQTEHSDTEYTGVLGPTASYDPPLKVPQDVTSIQDAVNISVPDATIEVDDGVYQETMYTGTQVGGLKIDGAAKDGLTVTAADNASPTILYPQDAASTMPAVDIDAYDVTFEGIDIIVQTEANYHIRVADGVPGGQMDAGNVTISNLTTQGTAASDGIKIGDGLGAQTGHGAVISNVSVSDGETGIYVQDSSNFVIEDSEITDAEIGIESRYDDSSGHIINNTIEATQTGIEGEITTLTVEENEIHAGDSGMFFSPLAAGFAAHAVDENTVHGADAGIVAEADSATDVAYIDSIDSNEFIDVDTAVDISGDFEVNDITHNEIVDGSTGINTAPISQFDGPDLTPDVQTVEYNQISATLGLQLDSTAVETVRFNDFAATSEAMDVTDMETTFDGRLNYYGDQGITDAMVEHEIEFNPVLDTAPTGDIGADTELIRTEFHVTAEETYTFGVPAATDNTVADAFGDVDGVVYGFDPGENSWQHLSGDDQLNALQGVVLVTESSGTVAMDFQSDTPTHPGEVEVTEGWNFISAPIYGDIETAFDTGTMEASHVHHPFSTPEGQPGSAGEFSQYEFGSDDPVHVSPFEGMFVFVEEEGVVPTELLTNPTADDLESGLQIDREFDSVQIDPPASSVTSASVETNVDLWLTSSDLSADTTVQNLSSTERTSMVEEIGSPWFESDDGNDEWDDLTLGEVFTTVGEAEPATG